MVADEVDALLGRRRDHEHEAVTSMKTEFMQLWDGFLTESRANVMVLAATNRPYDLDEAVLRRRGLPIAQLFHSLRTESGQGSCANVMLVALIAATNTQHSVCLAGLLRGVCWCVDRFTVQCEVPMPKADEREKILRLILQKHCRESLHSEDAVDRALLQVPILLRHGRPVLTK